MLELITGCMYSGKTELFIRKVNELESEGKSVIRFKPSQDDRYSKNNIVSHDGKMVKALAVDEIFEIYEIVQEESCDVVAIDEVQFFTWDAVDTLNQIADKGIHVLVAGVDLDFAGRPFGIMPELMAYADIIEKKHGACTVCGGLATRSQRFSYGKPASRYDHILESGDHVSYEPRCRLHHQVEEG